MTPCFGRIYLKPYYNLIKLKILYNLNDWKKNKIQQREELEPENKGPPYGKLLESIRNYS